ncbi:MAG: hypothetical protein JRI25_01895 [Deltaproteobacteria bacterium]|nr:hypothetical protein [Deltaproteobacteria bacterium]MBW2253333.1 hypothetical protein [Deltaproteobacteria bacterium]
MSSNSKQTKFRRAIRHKKAGKDRKRLERTKGTTPEFPVHTEEAWKNAPKDQLPPDKRGS